MRLIKVTQSINNEEIFINTLRIVSVAKGANGDTVIDTQSYDGSYFGVKESVEEVLSLINEAEVLHFSHAANPAPLSPDAFGMTFESLRRTDGKLEIIGGSPGITIHSEADIKRIQELEGELAAYKRALQHEKDFSGKLRGQLNGWQDAANIRSSVKISSPDDLVKRIAELEAKLKAWQEAASVDLVENPDDPPTPCQTPEQLVERLRHLFRWALKAEMDARDLRKPMNEIIDIVTKVPPF